MINAQEIMREQTLRKGRLFSVEKLRGRSDMMSAFKCGFFSDTLRPARERAGNCLTSVYMLDKTRKNVLRGMMPMHCTVWTLVKVFNGKDNEVLEYMS